MQPLCAGPLGDKWCAVCSTASLLPRMWNQVSANDELREGKAALRSVSSTAAIAAPIAATHTLLLSHI